MEVLITGASSGIGRDMAKVLASRGNNLVLVARNQEKLEEIAKELKETYTVQIKTIAMDLSIEENCKKLHKKVPHVDILINNAAFGDCGDFTKTSLSKEISMINTNILAYHILMKLYLIDMKTKGSGKILNVASIAGFMPGPLMATYYATKAYIVSLSESLKEELKKEKSRIQISLLCPGPVDTNFNKVANVKFQIREADSMKIAKYAINKMEKGRFYIIPRLDVKFAKIASKLLPATLISKITYRIQKRKIKR